MFIILTNVYWMLRMGKIFLDIYKKEKTAPRDVS